MIRQAGLTALLVVLLSAGAASAGEGMSYTARGIAPVTKSEGSKMRSITYTSPTAAKEDPAAESDTPASRVWKKYKDLAAGTEKEQQPTEEEVAEEAAPETTQKPPPATGFAAILEQYRVNKQSRSEMRTLTISKPALPEAPKKPEEPEVKKPEAGQKED